jgi:hypothetical protein
MMMLPSRLARLEVSFFTTRQRTILSDFVLPSCRVGDALDAAACRYAPTDLSRPSSTLELATGRPDDVRADHFVG